MRPYYHTGPPERLRSMCCGIYLSIVKLGKTMQTYKHFIGADIGKETLAICVIDAVEDRLLECSVTNTKAGMQTLLGKLEKLPGFSLQTTLICMEHTGISCQPMVSFFYPLGLALWL